MEAPSLGAGWNEADAAAWSVDGGCAVVRLPFPATPVFPSAGGTPESAFASDCPTLSSLSLPLPLSFELDPICNRASLLNLPPFFAVPSASSGPPVSSPCVEVAAVLATGGASEFEGVVEAPEALASGGGPRPEAGSRLEDARTISWYALTIRTPAVVRSSPFESRA